LYILIAYFQLSEMALLPRPGGASLQNTDTFVSLEETIAYRFRGRALLEEALTHKSFSNEWQGETVPFNERLEFLGDAVLDLAVSQYVYDCFAAAPEGELTRIRAEVVNEKSLALIARKLELGRYLRLGIGEDKSGGRNKDSLLANALEALLGAVFCDGGFEAARRVTERLLAEEMERAGKHKIGMDYKTRLQEALQARFGTTPEYVLSQVEGPEHRRLYRVEVRFDGRIAGCGSGTTKKKAEQEAAREALRELESGLQ
jgi:ribonuclease-3